MVGTWAEKACNSYLETRHEPGIDRPLSVSRKDGFTPVVPRDRPLGGAAEQSANCEICPLDRRKDGDALGGLRQSNAPCPNGSGRRPADSDDGRRLRAGSLQGQAEG